MKKTSSPCVRTFQALDCLITIGGVETFIKNLYRNLDKQKISLDFGVNSNTNLDIAFLTQVQKEGSVVLAEPTRTDGLFPRLKYLLRLYRTLKKNKYDIFQRHGGLTFLLLDCWVAKLAGIKKRYFLLHTTGRPKNPGQRTSWRTWLFRRMIRCTITRCFAVSGQAGRANYGPDIPFSVIFPGIETDRFAFNPSAREQIRKQWHLENNLVVGHVGRFDTVKNHKFLLQVFAQILRQNPTARLMLVGSGPLEKQIRRQVRHLQLEEKVVFTGPQANSAPYYQAFDIFVFPSFYEGLPLSVVEAQCSGLPCFISDAISTEVVVCNTALISLSKTPRAWADIILAKTKNFHRSDGATQIRQAGFDVQQTVKEIENLYLNLL